MVRFQWSTQDATIWIIQSSSDTAVVSHRSNALTVPKLLLGPTGGVVGRKTATAALCSEAVALLERYSELVTESLNIRQAIFQAVVDGDVDTLKFQRLLDDVNQRKENFKTAYTEHLREHRCSADWPLLQSTEPRQTVPKEASVSMGDGHSPKGASTEH